MLEATASGVKLEVLEIVYVSACMCLKRAQALNEHDRSNAHQSASTQSARMRRVQQRKWRNVATFMLRKEVLHA